MFSLNCVTNFWTHPNRQKAPYASNSIPIMAHPMRTTSIPPKKNAVPFNLWDWKKNLNVLSNPIMKKIPARKRIYRKGGVRTMKEGEKEGGRRERGKEWGRVKWWCCACVLAWGRGYIKPIYNNLWRDELSILTFPIAKSPLSKNRMIPSVRKASPKVTRPKPISEHFTKITFVKG